MLSFFAMSNVAMRWLAAETSDAPCVLKLASGDNSDCRWLLRLTWVELRSTSLNRCNFPCNRVNIWCKLALKERVTTMKQNTSWSKNREGSMQQSCFLRSLMLQLARFPDVADPLCCVWLYNMTFIVVFSDLLFHIFSSLYPAAVVSNWLNKLLKTARHHHHLSTINKIEI